VKTVQAIHLYYVGDLEPLGLSRLLSDLGLEAQALSDPANAVRPALILVSPGQKAPEGLGDASIALPADASQSSLRELLRVAMENIALKHQVTQLEDQARR